MNPEIYELTYRAEESHFWFVARRRVIMTWLERSLRATGKTTQSLRLLDYGCGTGQNLLLFSELGEAYGVDAAPEAVAYCRKRGLRNVLQLSSLENVKQLGGAFDVITLLDVLEHLPDDALALQQVRRLLKPDGLVVLTVPMFEWLWSGEDVVSQHYRRYTLPSLTQAADAADFTISDRSYFNSLLLPLQAAAAITQRLHPPRQPQSLVQPLPAALNALLTHTVSLEARILHKRGLPLGASLICTLRPNHA